MDLVDKKARKAEYSKKYFLKLQQDPERWAKFKAQQLKSYHKHKHGWKQHEGSD